MLRLESSDCSHGSELHGTNNSLRLATDFLEPMEACFSGGQELATVQASLPPGSAEQNSSVVEEEHLYSCFSSHGSPC
jgi:hypothetical protein